MAAKKKSVEVVKHKQIVVKNLGKRTARELLDEIAELGEQGFKLYAFKQATGGGVELQFGKAEPWSPEDILSEVKEMLGIDDCDC